MLPIVSFNTAAAHSGTNSSSASSAYQLSRELPLKTHTTLLNKKHSSLSHHNLRWDALRWHSMHFFETIFTNTWHHTGRKDLPGGSRGTKAAKPTGTDDEREWNARIDHNRQAFCFASSLSRLTGHSALTLSRVSAWESKCSCSESLVGDVSRVRLLGGSLKEDGDSGGWLMGRMWSVHRCSGVVRKRIKINQTNEGNGLEGA